MTLSIGKLLDSRVYACLSTEGASRVLRAGVRRHRRPCRYLDASAARRSHIRNVRATRQAKCARCGCCALADLARRASPRWCATRARPRLQHAARAGARPRRRLLQPAASNRAPRSCSGSRRVSIRSRLVLTRRTRRACACTRGSTSTWSRAPPTCRSRATHLVHRHPEWLMVPRDIAQELARMPADSPAYVGKLARWTRSAGRATSKAFTPRRSSRPPRTRRSRRARYRDALPARRRPLRLRALPHRSLRLQPRARFASSATSIRPQLTTPRCAASSTPAKAKILFAYPDGYPDEWQAFRVSRMTALDRAGCARRSRRYGRTRSSPSRPRRISAKPREHRLQDWGAGSRRASSTPCARWPTRRSRSASQSRSPRRATSRAAEPVWAGIGAYRLPPAQTVDNIQTARRLGAAGVILFSYDSLIDPRQAHPTTSLLSAARLSPTCGWRSRHRGSIGRRSWP